MTNWTRRSFLTIARLCGTGWFFWSCSLGFAGSAAPSSLPSSQPTSRPVTPKASAPTTSRPTSRPVRALAPGSLTRGLLLLARGNASESSASSLRSSGVRFGDALTFQAASSSLRVLRPFSVGDRTLGFWVKMTPGSEGAALVTFLDEHQNWSLQLRLHSSGEPTLAVFNSARSASKEGTVKGARLSSQRWSHLSLRLDRGKQRSELYLNGSLVLTVPLLPSQRPYYLQFGKTRHGVTAAGALRDVSLHDRVLRPAELRLLASPGGVLRKLKSRVAPVRRPSAAKPSQTPRPPARTQKELLFPLAGLSPYKGQGLHRTLSFLLHCDPAELGVLFTRFVLRGVRATKEGWKGSGCAFNGHDSYLRTDRRWMLENSTFQFRFRTTKRGGGLFSLQHPIRSSLRKGKTPKLAWGWQVGILDNGRIEVNAFHDKEQKTYSFQGVTPVSRGLWHHLAVSVSKVRKGKRPRVQVTLYLNGRVEKRVVWPVMTHVGQLYLGGAPHFGYFQGEMDDVGLFRKKVSDLSVRWYATARSPLATLKDPQAEARNNAAETQKLSPAQRKAYQSGAVRTFRRGLALSKKAARKSSASLWKIAQEMLRTSQLMLTALARSGSKLPRGLDFRLPVDLPPAPPTRPRTPSRGGD